MPETPPSPSIDDNHHSILPIEHIGESSVTIDVDEETARQAWRTYQTAAEDGYPESFDTFLFNFTSTEWEVTVDGEPLAKALAEEDLDVDGIDHQASDD